ncbi:prespore-specific protein [Heterostelium album PN500]|uniref:Prespore-specific protein n=1 Tax=Heterostelium pallidum (strain ATCC 26659 / Pp 5 / PN500) TaxID=670386 RepID=D3BJS9_HETP5|nr:prespore-specific protein [Heterostelium album PN500]EFA78159.1 prespore-specific protein [Heterostelium album PN500]|eukprot:XP_020430285.1 prespore-specific protein [Heterostelium album PN500]
MEEEVFSDPQGRLLALLRGATTSDENTIGGGSSIINSNELSQFLWAQRDLFSANKFLQLKPIVKEISEQQRKEIRIKKQFNLNGDIIEVVDDFINIAFQISDKLNIDEYLACQTLARVVNMTSTRDATLLINQCEEYLYQARSCYLDTLREILNMFMCELLSQHNDCLVTVLLRLLEEKIRNITVPTNQKESTYRLQECQKIVDCLFLISFQFTLKEESIRSLISKLKEVSKLYSNQQPNNTLYSPLFQITFTLLLNIFVIFVESKVLLMNPHEHKPTVNTALTSNTFLTKVEADITSDWEHNLSIQSTLQSVFYLLKLKESANDFDQWSQRAFPKDRNPAEFLARIVEFQEFKNNSLKNFYLFVLDEYCCSLIQYFPINDKMNCMMMAALTVCNGIEVYNFFTKDSAQFTWNKILQHMQFYIESLNQPNTELSPSDTEALNAFLCLITEVINYSPHLAQMLSRSTPILLLFFRYVTAPVSVGLKSTTLKAITACAKYPIYVPDIWKLLNESEIFPSGLRMESQSSEHGEFPFTQQFLELFYQLIQGSPFLFDRSNDSVMQVYLEHIMNLFSSFNNKAFNNILDKWKFTLTILNIFVFCLSHFKSSIINHVIDRKHPVYPLYIELTRESHNLTLQTIINIIDTATNENYCQVDRSSEPRDSIESVAFDLLFRDLHSAYIFVVLGVLSRRHSRAVRQGARVHRARPRAVYRRLLPAIRSVPAVRFELYSMDDCTAHSVLSRQVCLHLELHTGALPARLSVDLRSLDRL